MLYNKKVPISESALLVIDAQDSFKVGPRWERRNNRDFETNVGRLVELYRKHGLPVIYFLHTDDDPGFERGGPHYKLMDFLSPLGSEPVLHKDTRNVFTSTGLPALLMEKGVRRVAITGIQMEQCCETSARVAADLGYAVDFITEATMTFPIPNHDKPGEELGVDAIRKGQSMPFGDGLRRLPPWTRLRKNLPMLRGKRSMVKKTTMNHSRLAFMPELEIRAISDADRQLWEPLWFGYLDSYEKTLPQEVTEFTWKRLTTSQDIHGRLALSPAGEALGLVHFLIHPSTSNIGGNCYLQDLFVVPAARGRRVGRRLIAAVEQTAREMRAALVYWQTEEFNGTARRLYERVAKRSPFIRYQIEL